MMRGIILLSTLVLFSLTPIQRVDKYTLAIKDINNTFQSNENFIHKAYENTAFLVDTFGPRLWGSVELEKALDYLKIYLTAEGFDNVHLQQVPDAPKWKRGKERLTLYSPRPYPQKVPMIGLGYSVGGNITAEVLIVSDFDDLDHNKDKAAGRIVLFNKKWTDYPSAKDILAHGPSLAAKYGAVGSLVRSVGPLGLENVHAGVVRYNDNYHKIPAAAITVEDAEMFERMVGRGQKVVVNIYMEASIEGTFSSFNLIGEIKGSEFPNEVVVLGGHLDSWDVGPQTGATDDAAGVMICIEAMRVLIKKGYKPRRTIRFVGWTGKEFEATNNGARAYINGYSSAELKDHIVAFEADQGANEIWGFGFTGGDKGYEILNNIKDIFLAPIGIKNIELNSGAQADTKALFDEFKIPVMTNLVRKTQNMEEYYLIHHTAADNMQALNPDYMDRNVISIASLFYILADIPLRIPSD